MESKNEVFKEKLKLYLKGSKLDKQQILDHVCFVTGMHRKAAVRKFSRLQLKDSRIQEGRGRPLYYTNDVNLALKEIWQAASEVCGELIHPVIHDYVVALKRDGMWKHGEDTTLKLLEMSEITVKRRVSKFMSGRTPNKGISATKPSKLKELIPIFIGPWKDKSPGYGQIDTVAHCGDTLIGSFAWTVNWTDVSTLWGSRRAQMNKGQRATKDNVETIRNRLPFTLMGIHPDTGAEFITWLLKDWCQKEGIEMTRSRPYHKDDNAYVEQKNGHVVRRFLGYSRFDSPLVIEAMNDLYEALDTYLNHFVASRKLLQKTRDGAKYKKVYDKGKTPYQRVLEHKDIPEDIKEALKQQHLGLNPLLLKREIDKLITRIMRIQRDYEKTKLSEKD
jgi:hypothetical protein